MFCVLKKFPTSETIEAISFCHCEFNAKGKHIFSESFSRCVTQPWDLQYQLNLTTCPFFVKNTENGNVFFHSQFFRGSFENDFEGKPPENIPVTDKPSNCRLCIFGNLWTYMFIGSSQLEFLTSQHKTFDTKCVIYLKLRDKRNNSSVWIIKKLCISRVSCMRQTRRY